MATATVKIKGEIAQEPKIDMRSGKVSVVMKINSKEIVERLPKECRILKDSFCVVHLGKNIWKRIQDRDIIKEELLVEGYPSVSKNTKGTAFLEVVAVRVSTELLDKTYAEADINTKEDWTAEGETIEVPVKLIKVHEDIHIRDMQFKFVESTVRNILKEGKLLNPICIKPLEGGTFGLTLGLTNYVIAKMLDIESVPAIISELNHDEIVKKYGIVEYKPKPKKNYKSNNNNYKGKRGKKDGQSN